MSIKLTMLGLLSHTMEAADRYKNLGRMMMNPKLWKMVVAHGLIGYTNMLFVQENTANDGHERYALSILIASKGTVEPRARN